MKRLLIALLFLCFSPLALRADDTAPPPAAKKFLTGAKPSPRHMLMAAPRFKAALAAVPENFITVPSQLSYWGNNQYGNCTVAAQAAKLAADSAASGSEIFAPDKEVLRWTFANNCQNGAVIADVCSRMAQDGFHIDGKVFGDGTAQAIDWTNRATMKAAIASQHATIVGLAAGALLRTPGCGEKSGWVLTHAARDPNLDHCTTYVGYGSEKFICEKLGVTVPPGDDPNTFGYAMFTWDTIGFISESAANAIVGEMWVLVPSTTVSDKPTPPTPNPKPWTPTRRMSALLAELPAIVDSYQTGNDEEKAEVQSLLDRIEADVTQGKAKLAKRKLNSAQPAQGN